MNVSVLCCIVNSNCISFYPPPKLGKTQKWQPKCISRRFTNGFAVVLEMTLFYGLGFTVAMESHTEKMPAADFSECGVPFASEHS